MKKFLSVLFIRTVEPSNESRGKRLVLRIAGVLIIFGALSAFSAGIIGFSYVIRHGLAEDPPNYIRKWIGVSGLVLLIGTCLLPKGLVFRKPKLL